MSANNQPRLAATSPAKNEESQTELVASLRERMVALELENKTLLSQQVEYADTINRQHSELNIKAAKNSSLELRNQRFSDIGRQYTELFNLAPVAYVVLGPSGIISLVNLAASCLLQQSSSILTNSRFSDFLNTDDKNKMPGYLHSLENSLMPSTLVVNLDLSHGDSVSVKLVANALKNSETGEFFYHMVMVDLSEQVNNERLLRNANAFLNNLAHHDPLTNLPNRMLFRDNLQTLIHQRSKDRLRVALIYFDLDGFKPINDSFGHAAGDKVLTTVAKRVSSILRNGDSISRLGGDEFTVIMDNPANAEEAYDYARKIADEIKLPFFIDDSTVSICSSAGICLYPDHTRCMDNLVKGADAAMYKAKQAGRDTVMMYTKGSLEKASRLSTLEANLTSALDENQLVLHYQPIYDSKTLKVVSVEALVRWQHPFLGTVSPGEFIPLAEKTNQIIKIGKWVLKQACKQAQLWAHSGISVPISINVSSKELVMIDFAHHVTETLEEHHLPSSAIEMEITESSIIFDYEQCIESLRKLKASGLQITIDDFGKGYSSLGRLAKLPVARLKIDRLFIDEIESCANVRSITRSTIDIAHELDLYVISEGIESQRQLDFLIDNGSDAVQGFMMSKAKPPAQITKLLKHNMQGSDQECLA